MTKQLQFVACVSATTALLFLAPWSANGASLVFTASLAGEEAVETEGTGFTTVTYDSVAQTLRVEASFANLRGTTTVAHIHAPTDDPGVGTIGVATQLPTFPGFPAGVTAGSYDATFDMTLASSFSWGFLSNHANDPAAAAAALVAAMLEGRAYLNIHTSFAPGGEIRGFLAPSVPEPGMGLVSALVLLGFGGMQVLRRRSQS
jgi:hypothetical protein